MPNLVGGERRRAAGTFKLDALVGRLRRLRFQGEMPHVIADAEQQVRVAAAVKRLAWQHVVDLATSDDATRPDSYSKPIGAAPYRWTAPGPI